MSYILDALKKAEAERELGAVPRLNSNAHAHALPPVQNAEDAPRARLGFWLVAGTALAVAAVAAWWVFRPGPVATPSAPTALQAPAPTVPAPLPAALEIGAPKPVIATAPVAAPAPAPAPAPTPAPAPVLKREAPPVSVQDLPPDIKRALPVLAVSGAIHSAQASARMLIINGQLLHEGDAVAPGLVLLSIGPKSALLRYRETRFTVSY